VMHKIIFKHWQTGEQLEVTGSIDPQLNHPSSDRLVVTKPDGTFEDIIKTTVIEQVEFGPN
jgi:RecB family endonuclease NucS